MCDENFYRQADHFVVENMNRKALRNILLLLSSSTLLASATHAANYALLYSNRRVSPTEAAFLEGILFIIVGILLFLGSGGINHASQQATLLAAAAGAISGNDVVSPSEILRRDAWKPKGSTFAGLVLIVAGLVLMAVYFVSLYVFLQ